MSDLHTYKVMQDGDADGNNDRPPTPARPAFGWPAAIISVLLLLVGGAILYLVFIRPEDIGHRPSTLANLKQLAIANAMYALDHDERLPLAESWMVALEAYTKAEWLFRDIEIKDRNDGEYGIAFFEPVSGVDTTTVRDPDEVPLVFQSMLMARNAHSDLSTLPLTPRNGKANAVAFLDWHAKALPPTWPEYPITVVIDPSLVKENEDE